jgi:hypothetical protein
LITFNGSNLYAQTYVEYEPSFAVWALGIQMGVIEYGAYVNAAPSSLMQNFDKAIEMASASGCINTDGLIQLRNRMQAASSSNALYNDILSFRGQLGTIITNSCACGSKTGNTSSTTSTTTTTPPIPPTPPTTTTTSTSPTTTTTGGSIIDIDGEDIAANSTNIWVCLSNGLIYSIPVSTRQPQVFSNNKIATRIAVDGNNRPWIIDDKQLVWYYNGSAWINTNSGECKAIAMDQSNRCWVIDYGWMIKYFNEATQQWVPVEKRDGKALAVVNDNLMYHSSFYSDVSMKQYGSWQSLPGKCEDLDASFTGKLCGIGSDKCVYEYVNGNWVKKDEYGLAKRIAVAPNGDIYTIKLK